MPRLNKKSSPNTGPPSKLLLGIVNQIKNPLEQLEEYDTGSRALFIESRKRKLYIKYFQWDELSTELQTWLIDLTEQNMKEYYEQSSWGWNRQSKIKEFKHKLARHLIVYDVDNDKCPVAFVHFRFEQGYASDAALYCYELQIENEYRREGIGRCLTNLLLQLAFRFRLSKVLLTVSKQNKGAYKFYTSGLNFRIDPNSPSMFNQVSDYEILSRKPDNKI